MRQDAARPATDQPRSIVSSGTGFVARRRGWLRTEGRRIVVTDLPALRRRAGMTDRP
jgi:hypothetical protein